MKIFENLQSAKNLGYFTFLLFLYPSLIVAEELWKSDFDDQTLDSWSYQLNSQGIKVLPRLANSEKTELESSRSSNDYAAQFTILGDSEYLWNKDSRLNRVELQYKPKSVCGGCDTYIRWSFMLPEPLTDERHEFGYWESTKHYQQMFRFNLKQNTIQFVESQNSDIIWQKKGLESKRWYQLAMHVHWSDDVDKGRVNVWFDQKSVIHDHKIKTLFKSDEAMFLQLGILRSQTTQVERLWLDDVIEFNNLDELLNWRKY